MEVDSHREGQSLSAFATLAAPEALCFSRDSRSWQHFVGHSILGCKGLSVNLKICTIFNISLEFADPHVGLEGLAVDELFGHDVDGIVVFVGVVCSHIGCKVAEKPTI